MSDNWITFIPADPMAQPSREDADRAVALLRTFVPKADEVTAEFPGRIMFYDPGSNWSGVRCPACGADVESWWNSAIVEAHEKSKFHDLATTTPCCGADTSLNDLNYVWNCGLASFALKAMNPRIANTTPEQEGALAACLGLALRKVLTHL